MEREREVALREFEQRLGHRFARPALLDRALTHSSHANEVRDARDNEALEFLGDAVLGFLVAELLHRHDPDGPEGFKTRARNRLVSTIHLKQLARELDIPALLAVGRSERKAKGPASRARMWVNAYEAVLAAVYLDGGLDAARHLVERQFAHELERLEDIAANDHKTALQEWLQARGLALPRYVVVAETPGIEGPGFDVRCDVAGGVSARGSGRTKKQAQQEAARRVLELLRSKAGREAAPEIALGEER